MKSWLKVALNSLKHYLQNNVLNVEKNSKNNMNVTETNVIIACLINNHSTTIRFPQKKRMFSI